MAFVGGPPFSHLRCEQGAEILPSLVNLLFRLFLGREKDPTVLAQLWTGASLPPFCALSLHSLLHSPSLSPDHTASGEEKESFRALHNGFPIVVRRRRRPRRVTMVKSCGDLCRPKRMGDGEKKEREGERMGRFSKVESFKTGR